MIKVRRSSVIIKIQKLQKVFDNLFKTSIYLPCDSNISNQPII